VGDEEQARPEEKRTLSDEELEAMMKEELLKLRVSDVLTQTLYTISSLGYQRLGEEGRDLAEARLAIEAMRALLPVLQEAVPEQLARDFQQVVTNLQLAYASAARAAPAAQDEPAGPAPAEGAEPEAAADEADLEPIDEEELGGSG
jgi:hypothetical protein